MSTAAGRGAAARRLLPGRAALPAGLLTVVLASVLAGCGVPSTDGPQPLPSELGELAPAGNQQEAQVTPTQVTDLAWVKGKRLRLSPRPVTADGAAAQASAALAALVAGPTQAESRRGLSTEVPPDLLATLVLEGSSAIVDLKGPGDGVGSGNVTLATAQLALAVLLVPGIETVTFTVDGSPVEVPRADGKVRPGPVSLADYASLLGPASRNTSAR